MRGRGPVPIESLRSLDPLERRTRFPTVQLFIDPDECTDCGACVPECSVDAIHDAAVLGANDQDVLRNAAFFSARSIKR